MPTQLAYKGLNNSTSATPKRAVKLADEGIVVAIVAVTGVVDLVNDLIVPGAFKHTLSVRRPKVVDDHEWKNKAGRVLHVEEWMPGDPRLPKRTKDGKPWPKEAGALVATMQYNLASVAGRESFGWVKFYAESNEAEFSIGYKVPDGHARKRPDGVRVILQVNLFEFSHVLFGAAPLSMALEVKAMHAGSAGAATRPALGATEETDGPDDDTPPPPLPDDADWDDDTEELPMESKTALATVLEAKAATLTDAPVPLAGEGKAFGRMKGSYQERTQLVETAARDLFEATYSDPCVCVVATYDTEAVVRLYLKDGTEPSYVLPYTLDGDGIALGEPEPVELSLVAEPRAEAEEAPSVEDVAVVAPVLAALEHAAALASTEGKAAAAVRAAIGTLFETKSAEGSPAEEADESPAEEAAEDEDTITRETLPEGDWGKFRKTEPIEAMRMDGTFTVQTREGTVTCEDGWLAIDSDGYPYPIDVEEFDAVYAPEGDAPADAAPAEEGDLSEKDAVTDEDVADYAPADPSEDAAGDEGDDGEESVTLSPDDLYDPETDTGDAPAEAPTDAPVEEEAAEKSAQDDDATTPPAPEEAAPADDSGDTVSLDADAHFDTLNELEDDEADAA